MENGKKIVKAHVFITGRVQGVFYRASTAQAARDLGLTGWVRNLDDGRVEAVIEGAKEKVEEMIEKCKEGSKYARVEGVNVSWQSATGEFGSFEVVY